MFYIFLRLCIIYPCRLDVYFRSSLGQKCIVSSHTFFGGQTFLDVFLEDSPYFSIDYLKLPCKHILNVYIFTVFIPFFKSWNFFLWIDRDFCTEHIMLSRLFWINMGIIWMWYTDLFVCCSKSCMRNLIILWLLGILQWKHIDMKCMRITKLRVKRWKMILNSRFLLSLS